MRKKAILIGLILGIYSLNLVNAQEKADQTSEKNISENLTGIITTSDQGSSSPKEINEYSLPFTENFDSKSFPPSGWASFRGTNGIGIQYDWTFSTNGYNGNSGFLRYEDNNPDAIAEDWLVTPLIEISNSSTLAFYEHTTYIDAQWLSDYYIKISTSSQTDHGSFTTIAHYTQMDLTTDYVLREIDLSAYSGQDIYIAFVMANDDGDDWYVDNILIEENDPGNAIGKLIISEIAYPKNEPEGRFIELYNTSDATVDLTDYYLAFYKNTRRINLTGTIGVGEKFVYAPNASDFQNTYGFAANQADGGIDPSWFNGTDAIILLFKKNKASYTRSDTYGVVKTDGSDKEWEYGDKHAVRKANIIEDINPFNPNEWIVSTAYATAPDFSDKFFDVTPGVHNQNYYWNGTHNNEWDNYKNWTVIGGTQCIPDAGANVIIPNNTSNNADEAKWIFPYYFNTLSVQDGADFTMTSNSILTIAHDVSIASSANFSLKSDANGTATFIPKANVNGEVTVERYINTISGTPSNAIWHLYSSPFSDMQTSSLMDQYLKYWDEPSTSWIYVSATDYELIPGKGYALLMLDDFGNKITVKGHLNTNEIESPNLRLSTTSLWKGSNLVGNPYTASLDWDIIQATLGSGIESAIHYWDVDQDKYVFYDGSGNGTASRYIPAGQAFFVHATQDNTSFTFDKSALTSEGSDIYYKSKAGKSYKLFSPTSEHQHHNRLIVNTSNGYGKTDKAYLKFDRKGTDDFDGKFDAEKYFSNNDNLVEASFTHNGFDYSINTLSLEELKGSHELKIRYGINGSYTLKFEGQDSFNDDQTMWLYDKTTKIYYDIREHAELQFYNNSGIAEDRFEVVFTRGTGVDDELNTQQWLIYSSNGKLNIKNTISDNSTKSFEYQVFSLDGKLVGNYNSTTEVANKKLSLSNGFYVVKLITDKEVISAKLRLW